MFELRGGRHFSTGLVAVARTSCGMRVPVQEQPASATVAIEQARQRATHFRPFSAAISPRPTYPQGSILRRDLDLLRPGRIDARPITQFDKAPHPDTGAFELFQVHPGGFKGGPIAP